MIKDLFISVSGVARAGGKQCVSKVKLSCLFLYVWRLLLKYHAKLPVLLNARKSP